MNITTFENNNELLKIIIKPYIINNYFILTTIYIVMSDYYNNYDSNNYDYNNYDYNKNNYNTNDYSDLLISNQSNDNEYNLGTTFTLFYICLGLFCGFKLFIKKQCFKEDFLKIINKDLKEVLIEDSNLECSICLNKFSDNNKGYELKCEHIFHKDCIKEWMERSKTCPICRIDI
jgi:hypothetical protein